MGIYEFEPENHNHRLDGIVIPGVTDIVSIYGDDQDEDEYGDLALAIERAADRGITGHAVIASLLTGGEPEYPDEYEPWIDAVRQFLSEHDIRPLAIETPTVDEVLRVGGIPDLLSECGGIITVDDWKFVSSICKPKVKAQLNGYRIMLNHSGVFPEQLRAVQFMPWKYRVYPVAISDDEWNLAYMVYQLKHRKFGRGVID
jgi:hypothetical protein